MELLARLAAEMEIRCTLAEYCHSCDDGRFDDFAACFARDAVVVVPGQPPVEGREAIERWITAAQPPQRRGKHVTVNTHVRLTGDDDRATAVSDFLFLRVTSDGPRITVAGRYLDDFVFVDELWLFQRREIVFTPSPEG